MLSDNLNSDKQHKMKIESLKEKYIGKVVAIEGMEPEGFWGMLKELEVPDEGYSLTLDCIAIVEVIDPELVEMSPQGETFWAIPCEFSDIKLMEIH